jgi:hypothetical protein
MVSAVVSATNEPFLLRLAATSRENRSEEGEKAMRWLVRVAVVTASMSAWPDAALACTCPGPGKASFSPAEYQRWLANFDGPVFRGRVVSVRILPQARVEGRPFPMAEYTFKVERVWKGVTASEVVIRTAQWDSACGIPYLQGGAYVVAAEAPQMAVGLCSPGYFYARNEKDFISALGEGSPPPER